MDFTSLPPEINSARMYVGPGSAPMLAAAAAWDALASELYSTASSYQSVVTVLTTGTWLGPAAASMLDAAVPYVAWTRITATQAEQTANQARTAAAAYETAFAETVPPPVVAGNRSLLLALVATNLFGQNTTAIAATEAQYAEMWAQDTGAMLGYASASSSATSLTPFTSPSSNTSTSAQPGQAAAVAQAGSVSAGNAQGALSSIQQALAAVPNALTGMAAPAQGLDALTPLQLLNFLSDLSGLFVDPELSATGLAADTTLGTTALPYDIGGFYTGIHTDDIVSGWAGVQAWPGVGAAPPSSFPVIEPPVEAGLGEAASIGRLTVPAAWVTAAPELRLSAMALPAASVAAAAEASAGGAGSIFGQMALAGMAGRAMAGTVGTVGGAAPRQRTGERVGKPTGKPGEPAKTASAETPPSLPGGPITSIAAELRELASLRDAGILTEQEFTEQKQRLLPH
ncbi:MAG: PPE domain-containing protein [Mycobacterium sp.]